ncbi:MAG: TetR/AcrR family transcriptional regulator [Desulfomonilia bacterium]
MARTRIQKERTLQILKALGTCLQRKSFEKTSIKDIAREAGVNHGVLHYYFTSKEDVLLSYIDYVIQDYQAQVRQWLGEKDVEKLGKRDLIEEIFCFVNSRITLNKDLSHIFVEIWEIALYNEKVRQKLKEAYTSWIDELVTYLAHSIDDQQFAATVSVAMVAFWEGMALFSRIFEEDSLNIEEVLTAFQHRVIEIL